MTNVRLLPVVILAIAALLMLKTIGLVTNGSYVLGVSVVRAAGASASSSAGTPENDATVTPPGEPTLEDTSPTLSDHAPTLGEQPPTAGNGHGAAPAAHAVSGEEVAPAEGAHVAPAAVTLGTYCVDSDAKITDSGEIVMNGVPESGGHGAPDVDEEGESASHAEQPAIVVPQDSYAAQMAVDCLPSGDAAPMEISAGGEIVPLGTGVTSTEQALLERLTARRTELQQYEDDLALRASIVDAAEKRIEERAATLEALETQISTLVDQRKEMEAGQFAGIVAMYEAMRPKDAAKIFDNLEMDVLLRVAKTMSPRKMAPILAEMAPARAQELTVQMAALADRPPTEMTPQGLAELPQIVGQ